MTLGRVLFSVALLMALMVLLPRGVEAGWLLVAQDEPAMIADRAVSERLTSDVANREISAALAANDVELANSFVELAHDHGVVVDAALADQVTAANSTLASASRNAQGFARGLVTGEPNSTAELAGTAAGDLFVVGDVRDAVREGKRLVDGEQADNVILGLACVGIAVTAGTYVSLGIAAPVRVGLSIVKVARKTGRIGARFGAFIGRSLRDVVDVTALRRVLAEASITEPAAAARAIRDTVKIEKASNLVDVVKDVGRVEAKAGTQAALDSVALAEKPGDMARFARLAEAEGGKTRAIVKLVGRAAITLAIIAFDLFSWALAALVTLFGLLATIKRSAEHITLRMLRRAKARRLGAIATA
jgi:hypothetical protein